jgi:hypothetical protein
MRDRRLRGLIWLATVMSLGHHIDHIIRGNHVGWPLQREITPFTYSLGVYPLIFLGVYLDRTDRVGPGYWALLTGAGAVFLAGIHFGPTAVEPPDHIIHLYEPRILGWIAFAWLVAFIGVLITTCLYALTMRTRR